MDKTFVKLCSSAFTKDLLTGAQKAKHLIEVDETMFLVWSKETRDLIFRGIKIRNNTWGLTFSERFWKDSGVFDKVVPNDTQTI